MTGLADYEQLVDSAELRAGDFLYRLPQTEPFLRAEKPRSRKRYVCREQVVRSLIVDVDHADGYVLTRTGRLVDLQVRNRPAVIRKREEQ